jgi:probable phosphoglycerate mutase
MKTKLFLVRHGQTVDNANQIMQGQTQGELTEEGFRQARELRDRLASTHFDAVIASDLHRSIQTAEVLAEPHGLAVVTTPLLRERDWGSFTGRFIPDLKDVAWPDDIETLEALMERAGRFLEFIRGARYEVRGRRTLATEGTQETTVLAVGHGIINKAIQAVHYGKQMREVERMGNCEVRILMLGD